MDECDLSNIEAVHQIKNALSKPDYSWLNSVILVGKNNFIKIYKIIKKRDNLVVKSTLLSL